MECLYSLIPAVVINRKMHKTASQELMNIYVVQFLQTAISKPFENPDTSNPLCIGVSKDFNRRQCLYFAPMKAYQNFSSSATF